MFERFTKAARAVVVEAQGQARALRHHWIGTEHVLLALLTGDADGAAGRALAGAGVTAEAVREEVIRRVGGDVGFGVADAEALEAIGIDLDAVRARVEETFGPGALDEARLEAGEPTRGLVDWLLGRRSQPPRTGHIPFTPTSKKALELALREALQLGHNYIGTEHLLLGILRDRKCLATQILVDSGVDPQDLRRRTLAGLDKAA